MDAARSMAQAFGLEDSLDDPAARLELCRRLRDEAASLNRQASVLDALALGLSIDATAEVDATREAAEQGGGTD